MNTILFETTTTYAEFALTDTMYPFIVWGMSFVEGALTEAFDLTANHKPTEAWLVSSYRQYITAISTLSLVQGEKYSHFLLLPLFQFKGPTRIFRFSI
jgi:hypothetical protein